MNQSNEWDKRYLEADTPWDKGSAAPPLQEFLEKYVDVVRGRVLVPGCGLGHDVRLLAAHGLDVLGIDISPTAIERTHGFPCVGGETYWVENLFALPSKLEGRFDWVWEHTCFCAIDPSKREDYVKAVRYALQPKGHFLGVFYLTPDAEEGPPFGVTPEELDELFAPHFDLKAAWTPKRAYPGREGREEMRLMAAA